MNGFAGLIFLVLMLVLMYVLMIRPQKKKEKEINAMRSALTVGDQIITIGGICGKIVKTKDETIIVQVGADKVKFEMMRWSVSRVVNPADRAPVEPDPEPAEEAAPQRPKRLKTKADLDAENARLAEERAAAEAAENGENAAEDNVES